MKRAKLMVGVLALSTALLGTGYAAWTDSLNLSATVGTGNLCVEYDMAEINKDDTKGEITANSISVESVETKENHKLQINVENLAPGNVLVYDIGFNNIGSLDAILKEIKVSNENNEVVGKNIKLTLLDATSKEIVCAKLNGEIVTPMQAYEIASGTENAAARIEIEMEGEGEHTEDQGKTGLNFSLDFVWSQVEHK